MAKFNLANQTISDITVYKTTAAYMIDFDLPEAIKEQLPASTIAEINGFFCMSFYDIPQVGDRVVHKGHEWRITERIVPTTRWNDTRSKKQIPIVKVTYLGPALEPLITSVPPAQGKTTGIDPS
jgi:hypothetical protein